MCKKADDIPLKLRVETEVLDLGTKVSVCLKLVIYCVSDQLQRQAVPVQMLVSGQSSLNQASH